MNVDSLSITPNSYQNTDVSAAQSSSNQVVANLQKVKNAPTNKFNLKPLPPEIANEIVKYLKLSDIKNLNKSKEYYHIPIYLNYLNGHYRNVVTEWLTWQKTPPIAEDEYRKLAVERMVECLEKNGEHLDLSYLHLTNLPNLKPLNSLLVLNYIGNEAQSIFDCFPEARSYSYELGSSSNLPNSIKEIHIDNNRYTFMSRRDIERVGGHGFVTTCLKKYDNNKKFTVCGNICGYTGAFEQDFLNLYRL